MKVIDMIKEKSDQISRHPGEFMDRLNPQVREYLTVAMNNAKISHWFNGADDKKDPAEETDHSNDAIWQHEADSPAFKMYHHLNSQLNEVNYIGDWVEVSQERINRFAEVTDDHQWIHTDPDRAKAESPFRSTIAHGFLTLSLIPSLIGAANSDAPLYPGAKMVVNLGLNKVRYPYPVKVDSRLRANKKVIEVKQVRRGLEVTEEVIIEIEGCRRPACIAHTVALLAY